MGFLMSISCAFCYAVSYIFIRKGQAKSLPPDGGLLPILVISAVALDTLRIASIHIEHESPLTMDSIFSTLSIRATAYAALSGIVGTCIGRFALYRSIYSLGATRGVIVKGLAPVVTVSVIALITEEDVLPGDWVGLFCLLMSVALLYCERLYGNRMVRSFELFRNSIALAALAAFAQGIGHAFRQLSIQQTMAPLSAAAIDVTTALLFYVLLLTITGKFLSFMSNYRSTLDINLLLAGLSSAAGVILFFMSIRIVSVTTVSIIVATEPILVALLSTIFFPKLERVTWWSGIAAVIVAMGVLLMNMD